VLLTQDELGLGLQLALAVIDQAVVLGAEAPPELMPSGQRHGASHDRRNYQDGEDDNDDNGSG
jgi:hypothetical protein